MRPALEDRGNLRRWHARLFERREFGHRFVPAKLDEKDQRSLHDYRKSRRSWPLKQCHSCMALTEGPIGARPTAPSGF